MVDALGDVGSAIDHAQPGRLAPHDRQMRFASAICLRIKGMSHADLACG